MVFIQDQSENETGQQTPLFTYYCLSSCILGDFMFPLKRSSASFYHYTLKSNIHQLRQHRLLAGEILFVPVTAKPYSWSCKSVLIRGISSVQRCFLFQWALVAKDLDMFHLFKRHVTLLKEIILNINKASKCLKCLFIFNYVRCFSQQQNLKDTFENLIFVLCYFPFMYSQVYFIYLVTGALPESDLTL